MDFCKKLGCCKKSNVSLKTDDLKKMPNKYPIYKSIIDNLFINPYIVYEENDISSAETRKRCEIKLPDLQQPYPQNCYLIPAPFLPNGNTEIYSRSQIESNYLDETLTFGGGR